MKLRSVMAGLAVAGAIPCMAVPNASVVITGFKNGAQLATIVNANKIVGTYYAGEFAGSLNGNAFSTFCTDIYESFSWNNSKNPYTYELKSVAETQDLWGADPYARGSYSRVSKLHTVAYADFGNGGNGSVKSAAYQFALWEVLYETSGKYDTSDGTFRLDGGWSGTVEARNQANTWLKSLSTASEGYSVQSLYSGSAHGNRQDFLVATPVPEPQTYALALVSLGIIAGYARRKREQP